MTASHVGARRVMIVGASGFIGSALAARLKSEGHEVRPLGRRQLDMAGAVRPETWLPFLKGVDAVVNCAGVLQDSPRDSTSGVHTQGAAALFHACERAGIRRLVHLSAIGVDRETPTGFSRTKLEGEKALMSRDLDWVILRPSVVVGRPAYGGSALFRGLAAMPVLPVLPRAQPLQVVQLDQVVDTIVFFLRPGAPAQLAVDIAGPDRLNLEEVVGRYRSWLRLPPARHVRLPGIVWRAADMAGDFAGLLGWRPPIRSTGRREMARGAVGDPSQWRTLTGIVPRSLDEALAAEPASVQERWFARLYLLKPLVFGIFSLFWITTGIISLGPGWDIGMAYLFEGGLSPGVATLAIVTGALADIVIGIGIAVRRTSRLALYAALAISAVYIVLGTILVPELWSDPLGPMLKIWPVLALNLVALAILEDR